MIAIDTNVLVRILVDDPGAVEQMQAARALVAGDEQLYLPQIVQVETVWVLETAYRFDKASVCIVLEHLQNHPVFCLEAEECFSAASSLFRRCNADFSDCLILTSSARKHAKFFTFDKKLGRLHGASLLKS